MLLRTFLATASTATLLAAGLVTATAPAAVTAEQPPLRDWGTVSSIDRVLKPGCHSYPFRYRITTPTDEWQAQIFLSNRRGKSLATVIVDSGSQKARGTKSWRICAANTVPGRHTMRMVISHCERDDCRPTPQVGRTRPVSFVLSRPR